MTSENAKDSTHEHPTRFTNVQTQEDISINQTLLKVELGKPAKLLEGVEGFNNTTLTRYLRMQIWTQLECALLAGGVQPKDEYTEIPNSAIGLQNKWLGEGDFQLRDARRILIDLRRDSMSDEISPTNFFAWLKSRPDPELHALRWLSEIEELKSETITVISKPEIKESVEQRQDRRLKMCENAGLKMDNRALSRLPDGVGKVAEREGVTRQAFTDDLKPALERKLAIKKRETIHRI